MEASDHEAIAIIKGKRTKRQRSLDGFSPSTSSAEYYDHEGTSMTEEEEDMANCLILLAQGNRPKWRDVKSSAAVENDQEFGKFTSRKYLETDTGSGKIGYYVYECRTCNRTFPSFQALGGHRTSHKKLKSTLNPTVAIPPSDEDESKNYFSLCLQFGNNSNGGNSYGHSNNAASNLPKQGKVHECSICAAEFGSGQALGGHMRRHRAPPQIRIPRLVDSKDKADTTTISLDLDLNLPAPSDRNVENVFLLKQHEKRPQVPAALVLSSPAMVDCHY